MRSRAALGRPRLLARQIGDAAGDSGPPSTKRRRGKAAREFLLEQREVGAGEDHGVDVRRRRARRTSAARRPARQRRGPLRLAELGFGELDQLGRAVADDVQSAANLAARSST